MKGLFLLLFFWCGFQQGFTQQRIKGIVIDNLTQEPIPFVNLTTSNTSIGTATGIDGKFSFILPVDYQGLILVSHVGYNTLRLPHTEFSQSLTTIQLSATTQTLHTVTIQAGENPANAIIRKTILNRSKHDPDQLTSFQYTAYNKVSFKPSERTSTTDSLVKQIRYKRDTATINSAQKELIEFDSISKRMNFFLSESITEKKVLNPKHAEERLVALQVSGFTSPLFTSVATNFQPFSFYKPYIPLLGVDYINPISDGTFNRYNFYLTDTVFHYADTVFVIEFEAKNRKMFRSLKGFLSISTNNWAIKNIEASSDDDLAKTAIQLQQNYERINDTWFPSELNTDIEFNELTFGGRHLRIEHRTTLSNIKINPTLSTKAFSGTELILDKPTETNSDELLKKYRSTELDSLDENTYIFFDTLQAMKRIQKIEKFFDAFITRSISIGAFELDLTKLITVNAYEGSRLGMGFSTNKRFSNVVGLSAYVGYGINDKITKHGGELALRLSELKNAFLKFSYKDDLLEVGNAIKQPIQNSGEVVRSILSSRFDRVQQYKASLSYRLLRGLYLEPTLVYQDFQPTYSYSITKNQESLATFTIAESGFTFRYLHKEEQLTFLGKKIPLSINYPSIAFSLTKAVNLFNSNDFNYHRLSLSIKHVLRLKALGKTTLIGQLHYLDGLAPYGKLFTGFGAANTSSLESDGFFQTMSIYEFAGDRYASLFVKHVIGNVFINTRYSKPELVLYQNSGYSSFTTMRNDQGPALVSMNKGYFESGIGMLNLLRFNYADIGYLGFGGSVFYRYGPYRNKTVSDNLAYRISISFSF